MEYMTDTKVTEFAEWLEKRLERKGWTLRELAQRAGLTHAAISNVLNGQRNPGLKFCLGIADALDEPPELVMRRAGLLPELPAPEGISAHTFNELMDIIYNLPMDKQEDLLEIAWSLYQRPRQRREE
jgi:transcriptional regulator with XRE-family HTH domain